MTSWRATGSARRAGSSPRRCARPRARRRQRERDEAGEAGRRAHVTADARPLAHAEPEVLHRSRVRPCSARRPPRDARWVAAEYARWLPRFMRPFLRVDVDDDGTCRFAWPLRAPLLVLSFAKERSHDDRQLYYVTGGLLARVVERGRARLEFRSVLDGRFVLAAIHDFVPRLPWFVYSSTQAIVHLFVMTSFGRHLGRIARETPAPPRTATSGVGWRP